MFLECSIPSYELHSGFIVLPGERDRTGIIKYKSLSVGTLRFDDYDAKLLHDVPEKFLEYPFTRDLGRQVEQEFTYTFGQGWHQMCGFDPVPL